MVSEMHDTSDQRHELHVAHVTCEVQRRRPAACLITEAVADLHPLGGVDGGGLPCFVPLRVRERIATLGDPSVHQRQPVTHVLDMRGNRGAVVDRARRVRGRERVERSQQSDIAGIEHEGAGLPARSVDQLGEQSGQG
jgi:hypothetical protein